MGNFRKRWRKQTKGGESTWYVEWFKEDPSLLDRMTARECGAASEMSREGYSGSRRVSMPAKARARDAPAPLFFVGEKGSARVRRWEHCFWLWIGKPGGPRGCIPMIIKQTLRAVTRAVTMLSTASLGRRSNMALSNIAVFAKKRKWT